MLVASIAERKACRPLGGNILWRQFARFVIERQLDLARTCHWTFLNRGKPAGDVEALTQWLDWAFTKTKDALPKAA